jgi:endonuclease-3
LWYNNRKYGHGEAGGILLKSERAVRRIIEGLKSLYPDAQCSLDYGKDYELLFSTRLAAQCTDARVNRITPVLFAHYPSLEALAAAEIPEVEEIIRSCGCFHTKARDIVLASQMLLRDYHGRVPDEMGELLKLPGVGRKTANLILGDIYGKPAVVADTHCIRIAGRLGLTDGTKDPYQTELQLKQCIPPEEQSDFCHRLVLHGRAVCLARRPRCETCRIAPDCRFMAGGEEERADESLR